MAQVDRITESPLQWYCPCGASGEIIAEDPPLICPQCGSTEIIADLIKKDGDPGPEKFH